MWGQQCPSICLSTVCVCPFPVLASMTTQSQFGVKELDWIAQMPDLNPIRHHWDELKSSLWTWPCQLTPDLDLTNNLVPEWEWIQSTVCWWVEAVIALVCVVFIWCNAHKLLFHIVAKRRRKRKNAARNNLFHLSKRERKLGAHQTKREWRTNKKK